MMEEKIKILRCPKCFSPLCSNPQENILRCRGNHSYSVRNGFYDFTGDKGFYWGEISQEEMKTVCEVMETEGYEKSVQYIIEQHLELTNYLLTENRIDWVWGSLAFEHVGTCLDIGSGWGTTTTLLASIFNEVWSFEGVEERIRFQIGKYRALNMKNITCVRGWLPELPFSDGSFDLVVLNGILEWAGLINKGVSVKENQMSLLREVKRVLSPSGCLYIGIENRFAQHSFRGGRDHSGYRYTSLMPRWMADYYVNMKNKKSNEYTSNIRSTENMTGYRTFTYSANGYRKLLKEAGFDYIDIRWVHPNYNNPMFSGPFEEDSFRRFFYDSSITFGATIGRKINKIAAIPIVGALLKYFTNGFVIYARKQEIENKLEHKMIGHTHHFFLQSCKNKIIYYIWDGVEKNVLSIDREILNKMNFLSEKSDNVTKIDKYYNHKPLYLLSAEDTKMCIKWLETFQQSRLAKKRTFHEIETDVHNVIDDVIRLFGPNIGDKLISKINQSKIISLLCKNGMQAVEHGDFWLGNILREKGGKIRVIDFEDSIENGDALFDITFFLVRNAKTIANNNTQLFIDNILGKGQYGKIVRSSIEPWLKKLGVSYYDWLNYIPYTILRKLVKVDPKTGQWKWYHNYIEYISILMNLPFNIDELNLHDD